jgi:hypothetical protein
LSGNVVAVKQAGELHVLDCDVDELAIATPGPSKKREAKDFESFRDLATRAIAAADAVVFLGYRFPETDAHATNALLGAIMRNTTNDLRMHLALGHKSRDSERLEALLRFAGQRRPPTRRHKTGGGETTIVHHVLRDVAARHREQPPTSTLQSPGGRS